MDESTRPKTAPVPPPAEQPGATGPVHPERDSRFGPTPGLSGSRIGEALDRREEIAEERRAATVAPDEALAEDEAGLIEDEHSRMLNEASGFGRY